jgi:hypothetical protein
MYPSVARQRKRKAEPKKNPDKPKPVRVQKIRAKKKPRRAEALRGLHYRVINNTAATMPQTTA